MPTSGKANTGTAHAVGSQPDHAGDSRRLLTVLARASTPVERLRQSWLAPTDPDLGRARFHQWLQAVADGDAERARRVLAERGLTVDQWRTALGGVRLATGIRAGDDVTIDGTDLPEWVTDALALQRLLLAPRPRPAAGTRGGDDSTPRLGEVTGPGLPAWVDPDQPWQFYPGFRTWLDAADAAVTEWTADAAAPVTASARRQVALSLASRMLPVVGPQLMAELQRRSRAGEGPLFGDDPAADWLQLWERLPVMARLQATVWRQWRAATAELLARIGADLPTLAPGAAVIAVSTGAGDQHADGRGVAELHLDDGTRWFLKPRSAGPHPVVAACYAAVDPPGTEPFDLTLPETHPRDGYTWVREVRPGACHERAQVAAYFRRAGAALRVLQALGATDLHHENFIATATQPVLVDLETAIGPGAGWRADDQSDPSADRRTTPAAGLGALLADTPTATSMVTSPVDGPAGTASVDIGALAGPSDRPTPYDVATLVLTDEGPRLRRDRLPLATGSALPMLADARVPVAAHTDDVIAGYLTAQARLASIPNPATLLAQAAPGADVRFVARPTQVYARLGQQGLTVEALADGVSRELVLERLWRAHGTCPTALIAAEQTALRELDVPLLTVPVAATDLITDRGLTIPAALADSPAAEALRRLSLLRSRQSHRTSAPGIDDGADDLRAALFAVVAAADTASRQATGLAPPRATTAPPDPVATLLTAGHPQPDGSIAWLGLDYDPSRHRWHHERLGPGLLGEAGIGLALVAADVFGPTMPATTVDGTAGDGGEVGTSALLTSARRLPHLRLGWVGADAYTGPAGTLYALARAAALNADPRLTEATESALAAVLATADHDPAGPTVDPVAGGLLALAWLPPSPTRDAAVDRLTENLTSDPQRASRDDHVPDPWARSLPSTLAGRLLAAHRWGLDAVAQQLLPLVRATATAADWRPADAAVLCLVGEPLAPAQWHRAWLPRADTSHRLLDCAHLAATHVRTTADPDWSGALATARAAIATSAGTKGGWFGDVIAPDARNLSAVHGLAAITLLGIADNPAAPDARTFG